MSQSILWFAGSGEKSGKEASDTEKVKRKNRVMSAMGTYFLVRRQ